MTKSQLIDAVAQCMPRLNRSEVELAVNTVFGSISDALLRDDRVEIRGFGSFVNRFREAHEGRNPKTGDPIEVPRRRNPFFTAGKDLRDRVNGDQFSPARKEEEAA